MAEKAKLLPWAISCVFGAGSPEVFQTQNILYAAFEGQAVGMAVAGYYQSGGTLPLLLVQATVVPEEICRSALAAYDAIHAQEKAEAEKVVHGGFRVLQADTEASQDSPEGSA